MFVMTCIFVMLINKSILPQIVFFYKLLPSSELSTYFFYY